MGRSSLEQDRFSCVAFYSSMTFESLSTCRRHCCYYTDTTLAHNNTTNSSQIIRPVLMLRQTPQLLTRYAVRFQYHGGSFLGFSQQQHEDCFTADGTDLRGYTSVETRLRRALHPLLGARHHSDRRLELSDECDKSNSFSSVPLQVSSRTDRRVHALGNTLHVDLPSGFLTPQQLQQGWQYHLSRDRFYSQHGQSASATISDNHPFVRRRLKNSTLFPHVDDYLRSGPGQDIRILRAVEAPSVDWNARFSATERTYVYRILARSLSETNEYASDSAAPFEYDRSWNLTSHKQTPLNIHNMQEAADALVGAHDFTSFRAKGCQQSTPVVEIREITIRSQAYSFLPEHCYLGEADEGRPQLITIVVRGNSFLYRMVRNLVGFLVHVGQQPLSMCSSSSTARARAMDLLQARDRSLAPAMAPAHGLFLAHVQHGDFNF
jgi:tRNA pseudouridine38-40 synthase